MFSFLGAYNETSNLGTYGKSRDVFGPPLEARWENTCIMLIIQKNYSVQGAFLRILAHLTTSAYQMKATHSYI
jgi:hypothetical protein